MASSTSAGSKTQLLPILIPILILVALIMGWAGAVLIVRARRARNAAATGEQTQVDVEAAQTGMSATQEREYDGEPEDKGPTPDDAPAAAAATVAPESPMTTSSRSTLRAILSSMGCMGKISTPSSARASDIETSLSDDEYAAWIDGLGQSGGDEKALEFNDDWEAAAQDDAYDGIAVDDYEAVVVLEHPEEIKVVEADGYTAEHAQEQGAGGSKSVKVGEACRQFAEEVCVEEGTSCEVESGESSEAHEEVTAEIGCVKMKSAGDIAQEQAGVGMAIEGAEMDEGEECGVDQAKKVESNLESASLTHVQVEEQGIVVYTSAGESAEAQETDEKHGGGPAAEGESPAESLAGCEKEGKARSSNLCGESAATTTEGEGKEGDYAGSFTNQGLIEQS
ncbi:hypothetical protein IAT38_008268 [Cryptococcus sp. DSM 104549]